MTSFTPAQRAHTRRILWLMLVYLVILPPLVWLHAHRHIGPAFSLVMAIAAALPLLGVFASWGRYLSDERDEYHQALTLYLLAFIFYGVQHYLVSAVAHGILVTIFCNMVYEVSWHSW